MKSNGFIRSQSCFMVFVISDLNRSLGVFHKIYYARVSNLPIRGSFFRNEKKLKRFLVGYALNSEKQKARR